MKSLHPHGVALLLMRAFPARAGRLRAVPQKPESHRVTDREVSDGGAEQSARR